MGLIVWDEEFDDIEEIGDVRKSILEAYDNLLENLNFFAKAYSRIVNGK